MDKFAKLFEYDDIGQVVVMADKDDEENPSIIVYCQPKGLGVCTLKIGFADTDQGWDDRDKAFADNITKEAVHSLLVDSPMFEIGRNLADKQ